MLKKYNITVNGKTYEVDVEEVGVGSSQSSRPQAVQTQAQPTAKAAPVSPAKLDSAKAPSGGSMVNAPMPGTIFEVRANVGEQVKKGDILLILEAMKMENEIMAPHDGVVSHIHISKGSSVSSGDPLVTLG